MQDHSSEVQVNQVPGPASVKPKTACELQTLVNKAAHIPWAKVYVPAVCIYVLAVEGRRNLAGI